MKVALFASGNGSNVQAIIDAVKTGELTIEISTVISDKVDAYVLQRAQNENIPYWAYTYKELGGKKAWESAVMKYLEDQNIELIVLAGFMRILSPEIIRAYPRRILNIHPSLLPQFPGMHGIQDAFEAKVKETGVTIHFVDEGVDTGPIVAQQKLKIMPDWSLEQLESAIHQIEHHLYPITIQKIVNEIY